MPYTIWHWRFYVLGIYCKTSVTLFGAYCLVDLNLSSTFYKRFFPPKKMYRGVLKKDQLCEPPHQLTGLKFKQKKNNDFLLVIYTTKIIIYNVSIFCFQMLLLKIALYRSYSMYQTTHFSMINIVIYFKIYFMIYFSKIFFQIFFWNNAPITKVRFESVW